MAWYKPATIVGYMATGDEPMSESDSVTPRMTRRAALAKGAGGVVAASSVAALLEAFGSPRAAHRALSLCPPAHALGGGGVGDHFGDECDTTAAALSGTLTLLTYPQWYG